MNTTHLNTFAFTALSMMVLAGLITTDARGAMGVLGAFGTGANGGRRRLGDEQEIIEIPDAVPALVG